MPEEPNATAAESAFYITVLMNIILYKVQTKSANIIWISNMWKVS